MKQIHNSFSWHEKPTWSWPNNDDKLCLVNDWVRDADVAFKHVERKRVAVQAGGACGVWPAYLAKHFKRVITFEPVRENYECLKKNIEPYDNIKSFPCGLSSDLSHKINMQVDETEKRNAGAHYASLGGKIPCVTIDRLNLKACDFIALDVEGFEEAALKGAAKTIERHSPVIMVEEKPLPHMRQGQHLKARAYLESIGYKQVESIHRDVVFKR